MILEEKASTTLQNGHSSPAQSNSPLDVNSAFSVAKFTDVIFVIGGREIQVHKNILLATKSPAFAAMFESEETSGIRRIEIKDIDPKVFEVMIQYIYTGKVESLEQCAAELFLVAEKVIHKCLPDF